MNKNYYLLLFFFLVVKSLIFCQTTIISSTGNGGFETGATFALNGWTVVNDGTNQWHVGAATFNAGVRGAYVSNDAGVSNAYTINNAEVSHFYMDVTIPAGEDALELSFKYKGIGETGDDLRVFWVPTTTTPVAGTALATGLLGTFRTNNNTWFDGFVNISCGSNAGTTQRLVFSWRNNNSGGTQPPIAIDNIQLLSKNSSPANDLPCSAQSLTLNVPVVGDNRCAGSASEPAAASCFSGGNLNTVWYSVICPASGQLTIRTNLTTNSYRLSNTQIALYSGTCGTLTEVTCNDNAPSCGATYTYSQITATGLTSGNTYFICVDGRNDLVGEFSIIVVDGTVGLPAVSGQDCSSAFTVCNATTSIGNPGYLAVGNVCDFASGGNCTGGERGAVWYTINIANNGNLDFIITANDYNGTNCNGETDYDFVLWKISGSGSTTCSAIASSNGDAEVKCNFASDGVCGLSPTGNAPGGYNACFDDDFETSQPVLAGEVYLLVVQNFSNSTSGFSLDFSTTISGVIDYTTPTSVNWTGGSGTVWTTAANWGGCVTPSCTVSGTVTSASFNQPILTAGTYTVNNLTINPGASLTLNAGVILQICGNFTNNGNLIASSTSTIEFTGTGVQVVSGSFTGADAFGNLTVNKTSGSVQLSNDITVAGNFLTSNATSVFNVNSRILSVAGNFTNNSAGTTFTGVAGSTLSFTGAANQNYSPGGALTLNNVTVNQSTASTVTITGADDMFVGASGVLTLTSGQILTGALEVEVANTASGAVTAGNASSFVRGNLRRFLNGAATSYDFPVGTSAQGYQRANITFTTATTIPSLRAFFSAWPSSPPNGPTSYECVIANYAVLPMLNNGYWTITASSNPTSGTYDVTLYNLNYSNTAGALGWTVCKDGGTGWALNGTCVVSSTVTATTRTGLNGFSDFGTGQSQFALPISLLSFTAVPQTNTVKLNWVTESETNNDFFTIERSTDGVNFEIVTIVDGAGNSSQTLEYTTYDENPYKGVSYYRLKQTDFDGAFTYSQIISVQFGDSNTDFYMTIQPNPADANGTTSISLASIAGTEVLVVVYNSIGEQLYSKVVITNADGNSIIAIDNTSKLSSGVYIVTASSNDKIVQKKLVIK